MAIEDLQKANKKNPPVKARMRKQTERQKQFKLHYYNPLSATFGNARQSALKSGYSKSYADLITSPAIGREWLKRVEALREDSLRKAELRLNTLVDSDDEKIGADVGKFLAKTLGREAYYEKAEKNVNQTISLGVVMLPSREIESQESQESQDTQEIKEVVNEMNPINPSNQVAHTTE